MLKYPTDAELEDWEAQAKGDKPFTLQKGQTKNAILCLISALRAEQRVRVGECAVGRAMDEAKVRRGGQ